MSSFQNVVCCLNPDCPQPLNPVERDACRACGQPLTLLLRGRYRAVKPIGRGGFGRTYLALDVDRLNTYCVIKQFAPQAQGTKSLNKALELFTQEAMRLNELGEHPQIPNLLAYFEQDRYLYLVQQRIEGLNLSQEIHRLGPLDEANVRTLLMDLLPVMQFIHDHKVIHRDITPSNIIRRKVDNRPVLIDFGVAKQFSETLLLQPGTRIGTEGYAPIEQLRSGQAYPSSDIYSLGATCLHLLTGCRPDGLYNPLEGRWMWREELAKVGTGVSPQMGQVLDRMVKDLISDRYTSAQEVLADLQSLPSLQGAVPGWVRQHKTDGRISTSSPPFGVGWSSPPSSPSPLPSGAETHRSAQGKAKGISKNKAASGRRQPVIPPKGSGWRCVRVLKGHGSWVTSVVFNPKTATLASGGLDDKICLWNLQTGVMLYSLVGHPRGVNGVVMSPKGQVLVSCGDDNTIKLWDLNAGTLLYTLSGHSRDVNAVALGPNGLLLASGGEDRSVRLWKTDKGTPLATMAGSAGIIKSVAISPDERWVVSGGLDNKVQVWSVGQGTLLKSLSGHFNSVNGVAISKTGKLVASASKDRTVRLWRLPQGELLKTMSGHSQDVNAIAFLPDSRTLVSGSSDCTVRIWDGELGELKHTLTGHTSSVTAVAVHRSGQLIASASTDKTVRVWQLF